MRRATLFLVVILLWSIVPTSAISVLAEQNRGPIEIAGDDGFTPENGVIEGSGTLEDPYVIANWIINGTGNWAGIVIKNTRAYFVIQNVTVYGSNYGIYLENVSNFVVRDSEILNVRDDGIEIQESSNGHITNNVIHNASVGIKFTDWDGAIHSPNTNITVDSNHIFDMRWYAIEIGKLSKNNVITGNTIENTQDDGIFIWNAVEGNIITHNSFENTTEAGVYVGYTLSTEISYNTFTNIHGYAIGLNRANYTVVHDNIINNCTGQGIYVYDLTGVQIYDNHISNVQSDGILTYKTTSSIIENNKIVDNGFGIYLQGNSSNITVRNNTFERNRYSGISLNDAHNNLISNNTILNTTEGDGIYIWNATGNVVKGNYIENTGEDGVQLQFSPNNKIIENYIDHGNAATAQGIDAHHSPYLLISGNTVTNANNGMYLFLSSHNSNITENTVLNNGAGIVIDGLENITISGNILTNNSRQGIVVSGSSSINVGNNRIEHSGYNGIEFYNVHGSEVVSNVFTQNAGAFQADNSTNLHIANNIMVSTNSGVVFRYGTRDSLVEGNLMLDNEKGFWIWESDNNTFVNNTIKDSTWTGVFIHNSYDNIFYLNHFENSQNIILEDSMARWYSPEPISYDYNGTDIIIPGTQFTSYIGNYWSNYIGRDTNGDGIGEEPYYIDSNNYDPYPISYMIKPIVLTDLVKEVTNTSAIFSGTLLDTGGSTSVRVWFEYGTSADNLTQISQYQVLSTEGPFEVAIFDLSPNTTYYFRAVAENEIGTAYGRTLSFTTPLIGNYSTSQKGPASDLVRITTTTSTEDGIIKTANGEFDIFLWSIGGAAFQDLPSEVVGNLLLIKTPRLYYDLEVNPVHDDDNPYLVTVNGKKYFNPFAIREVRYALDFLLNREYFVQEYLGGYGQPMLGGIRPSTGANAYFEPVYSALGLTPQGNENKALIMIEDAMQKAAQDLATQGYTLEKINGTWYFEGEPVTIKGVIRIEDTRYQIGHYVADMLEKAGFKVERLEMDRRQAGATVYGSDPKEYKWGFYTSGWLSTVNIKWPDDYTAWWYASWYGWLPSPSGWEMPREDLITVKGLVEELGGSEATIVALQLKYYNTTEKLMELYNMTTEEITKMLVLGSVEFNGKTYEMEEGNVDQYWDLQKISMALGVRDSQKVFLVETWEYFPVNKERLLSIAADVSTGLQTRWSLTTAETPDKITRVSWFSSERRLFTSAFNPIGGMNIPDLYSAYIWGLVYDPAMYTDLTTGTYIPVRCEYIVERGNITVPSDAVIYNSTTDQWVVAHAGEPVKAKITYNCKLSNWHDGEPMSITDVKYMIAFYYEWTSKDSENDPYYDDKLASRMQGILANIKGIEWVDNDTYVIYTDNVHPIADDVTANMNVFWASQPWQLLYAESELVAKGDEYGASQKYSFSEEAEGVAQLDLLVKDHVADLKKVLEALKAKKAVPSAIADDVSDPTAGYDAIINWINSKGHAVISNGPFYLDYYDPNTPLIELRAFRDPTYPFTLEEIKQMIGMGDYNPPNIMNFKINPTTVDVGNATTISWMVSDDSQITEVSLSIEQPNGTVITESFDPSLSVYSYTYNVSEVGTYTATVRAVDKWGNTNEVSMEFYGQKVIVETVIVNETTTNVTVQEEDLELGIDVNETSVSNETQIVINATVTTNEDEIIKENASSLAVAPVVANTTENETQSVAAVKYVVVDVSTTDENTTAEDVVEKYTLKVSYDEGELGTIDESTLSLYYWNGSAWIRVVDYINSTIPNGPFVYDAGVNTVENYVWAVVDHFSIYALGGVSKPIINITSPEDRTEFYTNTTANVTIAWEAEDKLGIDHYEIKLNDGPWIKVGGDKYTFYDLPEGEYTVYVKAINLAGQYSEAIVTFKVIVLTAEEQKEIIEKLREWEEAYFMYIDMFEEAYTQAKELGIDNETLSLALEYKQVAQEYYLQAKELGDTPKAVPYMRHAVVRMRKGYEVLEQAIRQKQKTKK